MRPFEELGAALARTWGSHSFDAERFPDLAADALRAHALPDRVSPEALVAWFIREPVLPGQLVSGDDMFGEPAITLFTHPKFYVEALFWHTGTTSVHQHAFSGAFTVLAGSSLHCRYDFRVDDRINENLLLGATSVCDVRLLRPGDVERILPGHRFTHSAFHLDAPSVTIVVRTFRDLSAGPQYELLPPTLAVDVQARTSVTARRLKALRLLRKLDAPTHEPVARALIATSAEMAWEVLRDAALTAPDVLERYLVLAREIHGARIDAMGAAIDEDCRRRTIVDLRSIVTEPDHRFFLALVMNLTDRDRIYAAIRAREGDVDPRARVLHWIEQLADRGVIGIRLDDLHRTLLTHALDGDTFEQILHALRSEYDDGEVEAQREELRAQLLAIRRLPVLRPLFT